MSKKLTYWQLIESSRIEVPVIQREFAQGRDEDRIKALRKGFVRDIKSSLTRTNNILHLGFIYGKIEGKDKYEERIRNQRAIENILSAVEGYAQHLDMRIKTEIDSNIELKSNNSNLPIFIPLDGQQRLTTLYLLHWYLSLYSVDRKSELIDILSQFTYKTRKSSFEFCRAITDLNVHEDFNRLEDNQLSKFIQKRKWFRKSWLKDSTVSGMLTMLDEIQEQFHDIDDKNLLINVLLKEDAPIHFDFLDLDELNQTDELYVKMNARGKQLSEFEHFKAWLIQYVKENNIVINESKWKIKLDKEWLDLFWHNKKGDLYSIDEVIYNAFKQITLFDYIATSDKNENSLAFSRIVRDSTFIPFTDFIKNDFFNKNTINFLFRTLNELCDKNEIEKYQSWLEEITGESFFGLKLDISKFFIGNAKNPDIVESVFYYSFLLYLTSSSNDKSELQFKKWMRFSRNIIYNTYIQNPENFFDAISSIYKLSSYISSIDEFLTSPKPEITYFGEAAKQEILKANLIRSDEDWETPIVQCENHVYFKGDIQFILEFSKIDVEYKLKSFKKYSAICRQLFDDNIRDNEKKLLQRALLTCGDYLPKVGANNLIPLPNRDSLRARRDNWKRVFNNANYREVLKSLCDKMDNLSNTVEEELINLIDNYTTKNWAWYFIQSAEVVKYCKKGFIRRNDENSILLLQTTRVYGTHAELRSYYSFKELKVESFDNILPFNEKGYWSNKNNQYDFPCIYFMGWNYKGNQYNLDITYVNEGKYLMQIVCNFDDRNNNYIVDYEIIDILKKEDWSINPEKTKCYIHFSDHLQLDVLVNKTFQNLRTLS